MTLNKLDECKCKSKRHAIVVLKITYILNVVSEFEIRPLGDRKGTLLCQRCPSLLNPCSDEFWQNIKKCFKP